jgi:hypothetical protein
MSLKTLVHTFNQFSYNKGVDVYKFCKQQERPGTSEKTKQHDGSVKPQRWQRKTEKSEKSESTKRAREKRQRHLSG